MLLAILIISALIGIAFGIYYVGHKAGATTASATLAAVKAEVAKVEAEAVTDAKAIIARIKAKL